MSPNSTNHQLLDQYLTHADQDAFTELVRRHIAIVYSSAVRQLGDPHQAEDVTQAVFTNLARSAHRITPHVLISGWLLTATRYLASNARKSSARRHFHEAKAAQERSNMEPTDSHLLWEELSPHLDHAIATLAAANRDALLLRYFEGKTVRETALALGISEDAAKQRVSRALDQLRNFFSKRHIVLPPAAIAALLATHAAQAAPLLRPAALAASAIQTAKTLTLRKGAIALLAALKAKFAAAVVIFVTLATTATLAVHYAVDDPPPPAQIIPIQQVQQIQPDWRKTFNETYRLDKDQVLKLVPEPFIAERAQILKPIPPTMIDLKVPNILIFSDTDGQVEFQSWRRSKPSLRAVLQQLGFPSYRVELADEDRDVYVYGDWVYRPHATLDQKIDDLNVILREQITWKRSFKKSEIERPVYVVTGQYKAKPFTRGNPEMVDVFIDSKRRVLGNNAGTLSSFLIAMGEMLDVELIDETHCGQEGMFWRNYIGDAVAPASAGKLLANINEQLRLDFTPAQRKTIHWISTPDRP